MKMKGILIASMALGCAAIASAQAFSYTFTGSEQIRLGRIFRDGVPSNASMPKPFPGVFGATNQYYWVELFFSNVSPVPVVATITTTVQDVGNFVAAYSPTGPGAGDMSVNYLGDQGASQPGVFSVNVPANQNMYLFITTTAAVPGGVGSHVEGTVDGLVPVPEPASILAIGAGVAALVARRRRK